MGPIGGFSLEDAIRDINTYIPQTRSSRVSLGDLVTFGTVEKANKDDWTVDITLGKPQGVGVKVSGPQFKKVPVLTPMGDGGKGYGAFDLPQKDQQVMVWFIHNRTFPVVLNLTPYWSPKLKGQTNEQKKVTSAVKSYFTDSADKGYVHLSGTKWKVKKNGDAELVKGDVSLKLEGTKALFSNTKTKLEVVGTKTTLDNGSTKVVIDGAKTTLNNGATQVSIDGAKTELKSGATTVTIEAGKVTINSPSVELGTGALEALVKGDSFSLLFNAHIHPTGVGPSGPPAVPMTPLQSTTTVKGA